VKKRARCIASGSVLKDIVSCDDPLVKLLLPKTNDRMTQTAKIWLVIFILLSNPSIGFIHKKPWQNVVIAVFCPKFSPQRELQSKYPIQQGLMNLLGN
jgi:hypothetical protein